MALNIVNSYEQLGKELRVILQQTLPNIAFRMLLEQIVLEQKQRLQELDLKRDAEDFKTQYRIIKQQQELAEELLSFIEILQPKAN